MKTALVCLMLLTVCSCLVAAEEPGPDPLNSLLVSPDLIIHHATEIGLSDEQVANFRNRLEKTRRQAQEVQQRANTAMGHLAELLSADKVDEKAALKQLDELLAIEKEQKRRHFRIMIQIRNELTPEQRQAAVQIERTAKANGLLEQRLKAKLAQIERTIQRRSVAGQPPFEAVGLMQEFPGLMQSGQVSQAEALLDRVMTMLQGPQADRGPGTVRARLAEKIQRVQRRAQQMQQNGQDVSEIHQLMTQLAPLMQQGKTSEAEHLVDRVLQLTGQADSADSDQAEPDKPANATGNQTIRTPRHNLQKQYSPKAVRAELEALRLQAVAWRKIPWKSCLLDGVKASRDQNKPILLWIFIDRPIDDERC